MTRLRWLALVLVGLLAISSLSISPGRTFTLADRSGAAPGPAYVAYTYAGYRPNPVHPVTYHARPLALARSDDAGRIAIDTTYHVHRPFPLETPPSLQVELVYVPRLHKGAHARHSAPTPR